MPPTREEVIRLIEAKSILRDNWDSSDPSTVRANYQAHQTQWFEWIATADATWMPALIDLTRRPPASPEDEFDHDTWAMDIGLIFGVIVKSQPFLVVDTLLAELTPDGEPSAIVTAFHPVGEVICGLPDNLANVSGGKLGLLNKIVSAFLPVVERIDAKPDAYIINLIDTLAEGIGEMAQGLLRRIAEAVPPERADVHRELALYVKPPK